MPGACVVIAMAWLALFRVTGNGALGAEGPWLLSPSRIAVREQVPLALVTDTVVPDTEHPVDAPALKL